MKARQYPYRAAFVATLGIFLFLLALKNTEIAANGIKKGIHLATNMLIPSLFPFLVISDLALAAGVGDLATRLFARPSHALFGLTAKGTAVLMLGWLCGVPVGTVSAITMLKNGQISKQEFERLLLFSNTPSTGFLIGAVGASLFASKEAGIVLFFITLFVSFITGVLLKCLSGNLTPIVSSHTEGLKSGISATQFTSAVQRGFFTLLQVCGFVLFFSAITECVKSLAKALSLPPLAATVCAGLLELTAGVSEAVLCLQPYPAFVLCAFFAGFSGLSICLQLFSIAQEAEPRLLPYLFSKMMQGALCALLAALYLAVRKPQLKTATEGFADFGDAALRLPPVITLGSVFLLILFIYVYNGMRKLRLVTFYRVNK
ncbi:MAG: hypothetical protein E7636_03940 [Ruminococcaceae bacterium]|nr:hypothetical protein [Oscillospiraceae bacterium]